MPNKVIDPVWLNQTIEADTASYQGKVPEDLVYLNGHFDSFPLVAGVVELQWVTDKMTDFFTALGKSVPEIVRVDNLKFQKFVRPNDEFTLTLKWDEDKNRMAFQFKTEDEMCASGFIVFQS